MKKIYIVLLFVMLINYSAKTQTYSRIFTSVYTDSSAQQLHVNDVAVDSNGNSYLAGYKLFPNANYYQKHLFLLKVNSAGVREWIRYFNNIFDSIDVANAIALDKYGNIYVAGTRIDTFCNICTYSSKLSDIIIMKYDAAGNRLWLNRYHDSINKLAAPTDIVVSVSGNIIVTGSDASQAIIEKINKNGITTWIKKLDDIVANTACFDNDDNIIAAGASNPDHLYQTEKPLVIKLKANGNLLWQNVFDEYAKNGRMHFVYCDSLNNVYANGQTDTISFYNNPKIITIKYNGKGQQKWFRKEEDASNTLPHIYGDFKLDAYGNSYVTGYVHSSNINDNWLVTKYNNKGSRQWINHYDDSVHGSDIPVGLAVNNNGNVHVTGYSAAYNGNYSITTITYNNAGSQLAIDIFKAGNRSNGFASGIGADKAGNFYVAGEIGFYSNPYPSLIVIKYGVKNSLVSSKKTSPKNVSDLKLFPNPVIDMLNVTFAPAGVLKNHTLLILDVNGNAVISKQLNIDGKIFNATIDVQQLKSGIYTANIFDGFNTISKTFIKQ